MATKLKVTYADGKVIEVLATPRAQVETERHFKSTGQAQTQLIESSFFLAWASLHYTGNEPAEFEAWLDKAAEIEEIPLAVKDEEDSDPTPAAAASTGSSD